jgi:hypothetical protein
MFRIATIDGSVIATLHRSLERLCITALIPTITAIAATSAIANSFEPREGNPAGSLNSVTLSPYLMLRVRDNTDPGAVAFNAI